MQDEETDECVGKKLIISYFSLCFCKYEIYISDDVSACKHETYEYIAKKIINVLMSTS